MVKQEIAIELRRYIAGPHKGREAFAAIHVLARDQLCEITARYGFDPGRERLSQLCEIPLHVIRDESLARKVWTFKNDRKTYEDGRPRIRRDREGLQPMDIIVGDVHPVDILVTRHDGSSATCRMIGSLDVATNRLFWDLLLFDKGGGVRNEDVIQSFCRMVRAWGVPRCLYLDNGSEYRWSDFIDDALKLIDRTSGQPAISGVHSIDGGGTITPHRSSQIIRAMPYNAAAKPIEGVFKQLEEHHFSKIPGWIGGNRMRAKTANVGRAPTPFPGSFEQLVETIRQAVEFYHHLPQQSGSLSGRSPQQALAAAVNEGWGRIELDEDALILAFSTKEPRNVRQGYVRHGGQEWTCDELASYLGDRVIIHAPKFVTYGVLPVLHPDGRLLGIAKPVQKYAFTDAAGAKEGARRAKLHREAVRNLDKGTADIDPLAERAAYLSRQPKPVKAPVIARITSSGVSRLLGDAMREEAANIAREIEPPQSADDMSAHLQRLMGKGQQAQ